MDERVASSRVDSVAPQRKSYGGLISLVAGAASLVGIVGYAALRLGADNIPGTCLPANQAGIIWERDATDYPSSQAAARQLKKADGEYQLVVEAGGKETIVSRSKYPKYGEWEQYVDAIVEKCNEKK